LDVQYVKIYGEKYVATFKLVNNQDPISQTVMLRFHIVNLATPLYFILLNVGL